MRQQSLIAGSIESRSKTSANRLLKEQNDMSGGSRRRSLTAHLYSRGSVAGQQPLSWRLSFSLAMFMPLERDNGSM
jgi:hypothetical protein